MPTTQCPMPNAQCPLPNAHYPMPNAQCPLPNSGINFSMPLNNCWKNPICRLQ
ncbi:hypothetical protein [Nostoc sp. NOS(2021)]|uniref:hypothetical protein n=1 Tax=Nostoc sp. NOS(2021) TaxID=2815407 RepID=UPI0025FF489E|nr:hypothetical protein [Nostoc sp. NOS(2021)]